MCRRTRLRCWRMSRKRAGKIDFWQIGTSIGWVDVQGVEQAAQRVNNRRIVKNLPSGAEALSCFEAFMARLKSCPGQQTGAQSCFSAARKAVPFQNCAFPTKLCCAETKLFRVLND